MKDIKYEVNPADYVVVPVIGRVYPLWVGKHRLGISPAVEKAGKRLELDLQNTLEENTGRQYLSNLSREQALKLNLLLGGRTLNFRIARDFLKQLIFAKEVEDGNGDIVPRPELDQIVDEIFGIREPSRSEWLEDSFTSGEMDLMINTDYTLNEKGIVVPSNSYRIAPHLKSQRTIDLKSWLMRFSADGLPKKDVNFGKQLWFWPPKAGRVSLLDANPEFAALDASHELEGYSETAVRHVREALRK